MRGVFLHVLGDALGSVIVIISALVIKFVKEDWAHKVDPAMRYVATSNVISYKNHMQVLRIQDIYFSTNNYKR